MDEHLRLGSCARMRSSQHLQRTSWCDTLAERISTICSASNTDDRACAGEKRSTHVEHKCIRWNHGFHPVTVVSVDVREEGDEEEGGVFVRIFQGSALLAQSAKTGCAVVGRKRDESQKRRRNDGGDQEHREIRQRVAWERSREEAQNKPWFK